MQFLRILQMRRNCLFSCPLRIVSISNYTSLSPEINECTSEPCVNGGTCIDYDGNYVCRCVTGFDGQQCEHGLFSS